MVFELQLTHFKEKFCFRLRPDYLSITAVKMNIIFKTNNNNNGIQRMLNF